MTFDEVLERALEIPRRRRRVSHRALQMQFQLDDTLLEVLKDEIVEVHQLAGDREGKMLVCTTKRLLRCSQRTSARLPRRSAARWSAVWTRVSAWARVAPQGCPEATAAGRALRGGISNAHRGERHLLLLGMG